MATIDLRGMGAPPGIETLLTVSVGPASGNVALQEVTSFDQLSLKFNLDTGDEITFTTTATSPEADYIDELATDIWLEGSINQRYRITAVDQSWDAEGHSLIAVTGLSYKRILNARHLHSDLTYTQIDQGDIVWNLIAHTQALPGGNYRITKGATTTGVKRDRAYFVGDNIGDLLGKLQEVINGMYWTINNTLVLSATLYSAFALHPQPLQLGVNARGLTRKGIAAANFANSVYVDGDEASTVPVWVDRTDIATDPRGRWEKAIGFPTVKLQPTLQEHADGELRQAFSPRAIWQAALDPTRWTTDSHYLPGDLVTAVVPANITAPGGASPGSTVVQIVELAGAFNADGNLDIAISAVEVQ